MAVLTQNSITIEWVQEDTRPTEDYFFQVWRVENSLEVDEMTLNQLNGLSGEELDQLYGMPVTSSLMDSNGLMKIQNLNDGIYYGRFPETVNRLRQLPFLIKLPLNGVRETTLIPKVEKRVLGQVELTKVNEEGKRLQGVGFRLYQETTDLEIPLNEQLEYDLKGQPKELFTDENGRIHVTGLPLGEYYFKEITPLAGYKNVNQKISFKITNDSQVQLRAVNYRQETGGYRFQKVGNDANRQPLPGAVFQVMEQINGKMNPIFQGGRKLIVTSGKDGFFQVQNLPFGSYYLVETRAPEGYELLSQAIKFDITEQSDQQGAWIEIINERSPNLPPDVPSKDPNVPNLPKPSTPEIPLPQTGDVLFFLLLALGIVFSLTGYLMVRRGRENFS